MAIDRAAISAWGRPTRCAGSMVPSRSTWSISGWRTIPKTLSKDRRLQHETPDHQRCHAIAALAQRSALSARRPGCVPPVGADEPKPKQPAVAFEDEPAAHALYNQMIETMRTAKSLSYVSNYRAEREGRTVRECNYRVWLKKPNYFRVESENTSPAVVLLLGKLGGTLIGDGKTLWIYWPEGRPRDEPGG